MFFFHIKIIESFDNVNINIYALIFYNIDDHDCQGENLNWRESMAETFRQILLNENQHMFKSTVNHTFDRANRTFDYIYICKAIVIDMISLKASWGAFHQLCYEEEHSSDVTIIISVLLLSHFILLRIISVKSCFVFFPRCLPPLLLITLVM